MFNLRLLARSISMSLLALRSSTVSYSIGVIGVVIVVIVVRTVTAWVSIVR